MVDRYSQPRGEELPIDHPVPGSKLDMVGTDPRLDVGFLVRAKRATYAALGDEASVTPLVTGTKQLEYAEGDLLYRDIYVGMEFAGQEIVYAAGAPVWSMVYAGGVPAEGSVAAVDVFRILRDALRSVDESAPFRGPEEHREGDVVYRNEIQGDVGCFEGRETISVRGETVYELTYAGGAVS
jgi:hypothetical protein